MSGTTLEMGYSPFSTKVCELKSSLCFHRLAELFTMLIGMIPTLNSFLSLDHLSFTD